MIARFIGDVATINRIANEREANGTYRYPNCVPQALELLILRLSATDSSTLNIEVTLARMKIIIGANGTTQSGWLSLERSQLDLLDRDTWARLFCPGSVDAVLTEHVLEHLTLEEADRAARNVYEFLRPGGYWRIAVPDANNPSKWCQLCNRPGSLLHLIANVLYTPGEPFHQVFYQHGSLTSVLTNAGFLPRLLEWYDGDGRFHRESWSYVDGEVRRSFGHPYLKSRRGLGGVYNTSLIVDAIKP